MKVSRTYHILTEFSRIVLTFLFFYTGYSKLTDHESFSLVIGKSALVGAYANLLSRLIPISEIAVGILLIVPALKFWGFFGAFLLMSAFTVYVSYMILFEPNLPCSCGGIISSMTWHQHLVFNIILTALAAIALKHSNKYKLFIAINRRSRTPV